MDADSSQCKVPETLSIIAGKWKPTILYYLYRNGTMRFSELKNQIPNITQKMLTSQLRELEKEDLIQREVYPQVPPRVEYSISQHGKSLFPILDAMHAWGLTHLEHMNTKQSDDTEAL
ncbi:winged helix-turn-helix transcriptional regulator [Paenibacillus marinisediminis]